MPHKYMILDTETTGLPLRAAKGAPPIPADAPGQPRLAAFAALCLTPDLEEDDDYSFMCLVRPDGWTMPPDVAAINGLPTEKLEAEGIPVQNVLNVYSDAITAGWIVVAHNAQFDTKIMRGELRRAGMPDLFEQTLNICTMKACRALGLPRVNLQACYRHFHDGNEFPDAHSPWADVRACAAVFRKLMAIGAVPESSVLLASNRGE